jgi:hypothetical protein
MIMIMLLDYLYGSATGAEAGNPLRLSRFRELA